MLTVLSKVEENILCPLCRKFASELHIKKDPILDVLVEAFSQYYDKDILNKDPVEKSCSQCDRKINVTSYCVDCKASICQTCGTRHLLFEVMSEHRIVAIAEAGTHPVVNVTKYCPKHITKPIKLSCVPCGLAICVDCKIEDHDTHKTEDVTSALATILPDIRALAPLPSAEKSKQIEVKHDLVSIFREVTCLGKEIMGNAQKTRDDLISRAMREYNTIEETVTKFVQSVTKEASIREDGANNSISSIDSMSSWINVLAGVAEGPAVLFEVKNERFLDRAKVLLRECQNSHDVTELQRRANRKPKLIQTSLESDYIVGSIQFEEPSTPSPAKNKEAGLTPICTSLQQKKQKLLNMKHIKIKDHTENPSDNQPLM